MHLQHNKGECIYLKCNKESKSISKIWGKTYHNYVKALCPLRITKHLNTAVNSEKNSHDILESSETQENVNIQRALSKWFKAGRVRGA